MLLYAMPDAADAAPERHELFRYAPLYAAGGLIFFAPRLFIVELAFSMFDMPS